MKYTNGIMLAPDGQMLARIGQDKAEWYLDHNLATIEKEEPLTIKLKFEPKNRNGADDLFSLAQKENKCVVCGTITAELTSHHIVPYAYRKLLPIKYKEHCCHDVVLLCEKCHRQYEKSANEYKKQLLQEIFGMSSAEMRSIGSICHALLDYAEKIPEARKNKMLEKLKNHFSKDEITLDDMKAIHVLGKSWNVYKEKCIVEKLTDIEGFVQGWRKHFLSTMKPKYMPIFWDENRTFEK